MSFPPGVGQCLPEVFFSMPQPSARCCHATRLRSWPNWASDIGVGYSARIVLSVGSRLA